MRSATSSITRAHVAAVGLIAAMLLHVCSSQSSTPTPSPSPNACYVSTIAGTGASGGAGDGGDARQAQLNAPSGLLLLASGDLLIAEGAHRVRIVFAVNGSIAIWAGTGSAGSIGDGGPARAAQLNSPSGLALLPSGDGAVLIADQFNSRVRVVWPNGTIDTWMGTGSASSTGDGGHRLVATINQAWKVDSDSRTGRVFVAQGLRMGTRQVMVDSGVVSTLLAPSGAFFSVAVSWVSQVFPLPSGRGDTMLITDYSGNRVYIGNETQRSAVVFAGSGASVANGISATAAVLSNPCFVAFHGASGSVVIAEGSGHRLRVVNSSGIISTLLGTGAATSTGDGGLPGAATVNGPSHIVWTSSGALIVSEYGGHRVRLISGGCFFVPSPVRATTI